LVGDKLIYPNDIAIFLTDQYKKTFNFDLKKTENKPVMLDGVPGHCFVRWHYLGDTDIFVERETLNQIWPTATKKIPVGLTTFFNKEKVH